MSADELLRTTVTLSPDPATYRPRPSSERTQEISYLLTSVFKDLYSGEVIGKDTGANLIKSRGGDNPFHQMFVDELEKIRGEYEHRLAEADRVEKHIIEARARASAEEERILNRLKEEAGEAFESLGLPPVASYFRWCVDSDLLKKHKLISPDDYITDVTPVTKAPKGKPEPSFCKETFSFHQHISRSPVDDGYTEFPIPEPECERRTLESSSSSLTLLSTSDIEDQNKKKSTKKSTSGKPRSWKQTMSTEDKERERSHLARLEKRHNFLKNPRFLHGRSLIAPAKKTEKIISGRKRVVQESNPYEPVFIPNPPVVFFPDYEVGRIYETTVELRNMTASSRHVRVIPPSTPYFSIGLGKFPGEGGIVAPGMSCHYTVRFIPDSLADFEDFLLIESQAPYPVLVPIEARRPPPVLTLPHTLDCGPCLVGGVKVMEYFCRNEGMSRGRFCVMPKSAWPPANFRSVATAGFVEEGPFGIQPALFELYPGQEIAIEVVFFPSSPEKYNHVFTVVCDNCQVKDITLTGYGEMVGLELVSVSGGDNETAAEDLSDLSGKHLLRFPPTNPSSSVQKSLAIRNTTHVALPYYWQIIDPNLQTRKPEEGTKLNFNEDTKPAFSLSPTQGVLQPHEVHTFTVTYCPTEVADYHSVAQLLLQDIPWPPSAEKKGLAALSELEPTANDVIALDVDFKGVSEPFNVLLDPYIIIFPGETFIGSTVRKPFVMWNNSCSAINFKWETATSRNIVQIVPKTGTIESKKYGDFELILSGGQIGSVSHEIECFIEHSPEPVVLGVAAAFKGPVVVLDLPSLSLGLMKLGSRTRSVLTLANTGPLAAKWSLQESGACLTARGEEESQFCITPNGGELPPLSTTQVTVVFQPRVCQKLETVLELEVEHGEPSYLPISAVIQTPRLCLLTSTLEFREIYAGVPAQATAKIFNQGLLPARFSWGELTGGHSTHCVATISPATGTLGPNEEADLQVEVTALTLDEFSDVAFRCTVEDMAEPLVLQIKAKARGLHVTYSLTAEGDSLQGTPSTPEELLLDFGSEVALHSAAQRQLILTNHTAIPAPFTLRAAYFSGSRAPKTQENDLSTDSLIQRTARFAEQSASKAQAEFRAAVLSDGKGAAFIPQPESGTLGPFQKMCIQVTAFSSVWGEYSDELVCTVGDLAPKQIPMRMTVKGCPIYFQMTGPRPDRQTEGPVIRFGSHISGGDTISRCLRINNPSPCDIRIDWETYNREEDDSKLVDLLLLYGDPFPLKDMDGNEIVCRGDSPLQSSPVNWDRIPSTCGSVSRSSSRDSNNQEGVEETENVEDKQDAHYDMEPPPEDKLISVILRPHEGVASDYPYCITPKQIIVPAGGSSLIHVSFTPLMLSGVTNKIECSGFALGYMSLDDKSALEVPGKVRRPHGYGLEPIRMELRAFVMPALLTVEIEDDDDEDGLVFYSAASDLIPESRTPQILTESVTIRNLKLVNVTQTPIFFRLLLNKPFAVTAIDPNNSMKTSQSEREEQLGQMVLHPQQNVRVKVSFCSTLELLMYQKLPADQLPLGVRLLESENGEKKLSFSEQLVIEYSNKSVQLVPLRAFLALPVLESSCRSVDFGTCFVGQTRTRDVYLLNKSASKSFWTALIDKQNDPSAQEIFSVSPGSGTLGPRVSHASASTQMIQITFTARTNAEYETTVVIHGKLGENPTKLHVKGRGSYDEKYEA
ncbi:deleted in lung and esophageal cancer protein 1 [Spea bombifrons]|uniref:deleted in lung and esophageal cancer protein 1 n=1 Tax=Spea bombifrons TaxID=233779 RepID=UPI00234AA2D1|nr:deleted in lung and esophageal cancer protein 1 [Spea bombifrons]